MTPRRVVITGMGTICPIAHNVKDFWTKLVEGKSGIGIIDRFDPSDYPTKIAAQVKDFNAQDYMPRTEARRMDLFIQYACAASRLALEDADLELKKYDPDRAGVLIGSGNGGLDTFEKQCQVLQKRGVGGISPFFIPMLIPNMAAGQVSIMFGARGPSSCSVTACATGTNSIGDAFRIIQNGAADIMISGGTEAPITPLSIAGFCAMKALSTRNDQPEKACRPFDIDRDGFVMGEGAGIVILEELEHALKRGAKIYAELIGYGCSSDAYHMVQPDPEGNGAARALTAALTEAGIKAGEIDYMNAHGTGTHFNDMVETKALKQVLGSDSNKMAINSTKAATGHMLGAAGAVELIASVLSCNHDLITPTLNLDNPDPECDLDYVRGEARERNIEIAASESLGFGGHNAVLIIRKFKQ
ncbi:MAG: beta-ketoacyl-[acyl-carrier-protein] synthase II [Firmicutes bacterium HGW-Firmicutes-15]|nr:MAG: beta-ketoacyl-[acyl-carrier-protein] synthase II [Firmicutes bacterium HGW-Firmicutes-15]